MCGVAISKTMYRLQASSSVANIDEWKWKLSLLQRSEKDQEIVSRDKRDRRDYEQISNLAKRMGLYR
jgi:ATP-dependent RNA helicase DHX36